MWGYGAPPDVTSTDAGDIAESSFIFDLSKNINDFIIKDPISLNYNYWAREKSDGKSYSFGIKINPKEIVYIPKEANNEQAPDFTITINYGATLYWGYGNEPNSIWETGLTSKFTISSQNGKITAINSPFPYKYDHWNSGSISVGCIYNSKSASFTHT